MRQAKISLVDHRQDEQHLSSSCRRVNVGPESWSSIVGPSRWLVLRKFGVAEQKMDEFPPVCGKRRRAIEAVQDKGLPDPYHVQTGLAPVSSRYSGHTTD